MSNTLTRTDDLIKEIEQRQRLEREVIEAAKQWLAENERIGATTYTPENKIIAVLENNLVLAKIVKPLVDFESKQKEG